MRPNEGVDFDVAGLVARCFARHRAFKLGKLGRYSDAVRLVKQLTEALHYRSAFF